MRFFLPTPIPEKIVREIVERVARAFGWQHATLAYICHRRQTGRGSQSRAGAAHGNGLPKGEGTDYTIYPEPYRARRFAVGELLYHLIKVSREDKPARYRQYAGNYQFFGAPVALFFAREKVHGPAQWADIGGYLQTVGPACAWVRLAHVSAASLGLVSLYSARFPGASRQFDDLFGHGPWLPRWGRPHQFLALSARSPRRQRIVRGLR